MRRMLVVLLWCGLLAGACEPTPTDPAAVPDPTEGQEPEVAWRTWMAQVRGALKDLEKRHAARDERASKDAWRLAYQDRFRGKLEPLLRRELGDVRVTEVEYAFGQLLLTLDTADHPATVKALSVVRGHLDGMEKELEKLLPPPPPPPAAPQAGKAAPSKAGKAAPSKAGKAAPSKAGTGTSPAPRPATPARKPSTAPAPAPAPASK